MPRKQWVEIVNTQDHNLSVSGEDGRAKLYVRIGEDGMGYNTSRVHTFDLDPIESQVLIAALQKVTAIRA